MAEEMCLTLVMTDTAGTGWNGAELFIFRDEDYQGDAMYTCATEAWNGHSCDFWDYQRQHSLSNPVEDTEGVCEYYSSDLEAEKGVDCSGCVW